MKYSIFEWNNYLIPILQNIFHRRAEKKYCTQVALPEMKLGILCKIQMLQEIAETSEYDRDRSLKPETASSFQFMDPSYQVIKVLFMYT